MAPLGINYRVFFVFCTKPRIEADSIWRVFILMDFIWCSVQSPELRLTLLRETLFVCLVQSPRLWLTVEEIGFLDYDSSLGKTLFSALYKAQGCGGLFFLMN